MKYHPRIARALLALAVLFAFEATVCAADQAPTNDREFVIRSIAADLGEIRMAEQALKTTSNADIKAFAKMMVADHTKNRNEMISLAKSMKWEITEGMTKEDQETLARLSKLTGKEFDTAYAKAQVAGHEKVLKMDEKWAKDAEYEKVRTAARKTAEKVREHLAEAKKLNGGS